MARQIVLEDQEWIEIVNKEKQVIGGFWWNPSDLDIVKRCENVIDSFNNISVTKESDLFEVSEAIKSKFDYLLGTNASEELFKRCNPLSPRPDGTFFAEYVLDVISKFIRDELDVRMKKTTGRIKKYTEKYGR